ncbi:hmu [Linum perenne]
MTSFDSQEKSSDDDGDEKKKESKEDEDSESKEKSSDEEEDKKKKESKEDEERDSEEKSSDDDDDNEKKESKEDEKSESKEMSSDDDDDKEKSDDDDDDKKKKSKKDSSEEEDEDNDDDKEKEKKSEDSKDEDDDKDKSSSYSTSKDPILTHKICGETRYPKDCLKSISPYFTGATDPESVLKMEVQAVRQGFVNAITKVKKMKKEAEGKWDKSALDTCVENFQDGLDDLDSALDAITEHNADELQTMLSSVLTYVTTCEDSMAEDPDGHDLPNIMNMEQKLTNLATNSLDIAEKQLN